MMKEILRLGLTLLLIASIATGILAWVNGFTLPRIEKLKAEAAEETRKELMPEAAKFEEKKAVSDTTFVYYIAKNDKNEVIGYTFVGSKKGYSSVVKTMAALDKNYNIINIKVFEQNETPGLGSLCQDKKFPERFKRKTATELKVDKDGGTITSITGATITTRAITQSLRDGIDILKKDLAQNPNTPNANNSFQRGGL